MSIGGSPIQRRGEEQYGLPWRIEALAMKLCQLRYVLNWPTSSTEETTCTNIAKLWRNDNTAIRRPLVAGEQGQACQLDILKNSSQRDGIRGETTRAHSVVPGTRARLTSRNSRGFENQEECAAKTALVVTA